MFNNILFQKYKIIYKFEKTKNNRQNSLLLIFMRQHADNFRIKFWLLYLYTFFKYKHKILKIKSNFFRACGNKSFLYFCDISCSYEGSVNKLCIIRILMSLICFLNVAVRRTFVKDVLNSHQMNILYIDNLVLFQLLGERQIIGKNMFNFITFDKYILHLSNMRIIVFVKSDKLIY